MPGWDMGMSEIWWRARREKGTAPQDKQQRDRQHKRVLGGWKTAGQTGCGDMGRAEEQGGIGWGTRECGRIPESGLGYQGTGQVAEGWGRMTSYKV